MHINLEADYAVRITNCLAKSDERLDAQTIADRTCVSLRFTLKIMRKLVAADVVKSFKGAKGGYLLSHSPKDTTMRQVIEAIEGPYKFSRCVDTSYDCSCSTMEACPFHSVYNDITQMVVEKLDTITFDQLSHS